MKLCLIGERVSQSYSKEIHNIMGLDYSLVSLKKEELENFVTSDNYNGFNVTMPYKKDVIKYLHYVDPYALEIGAVNVVNVRGGKRYGYNTDFMGMEYMIKRKGVSVDGKNVLVLGSGGASNCAVALMKKLNAGSVTVVGRTLKTNYQNCYELKNTQIIINTTPVGMVPDLLGSPIDLSKFPSLEAFFDAVYNPQRTTLVKQAIKLNLKCSGGVPMLVEQALCGEDIWLNSSHTSEDSEKMILEIVKRKLNVALTGMPGSGKTTVGKALATALNREFYDVDLVIEEKTGRTPSQIILEEGENRFREIESEVVFELSKKSSAVIALGGGSLLREVNREYLSRNSVTVYLKRDLESLITDNRPLSKSVGVKALYEQRKPIYESADITVENVTVDKAVKEIIDKYEIACSKWS